MLILGILLEITAYTVLIILDLLLYCIIILYGIVAAFMFVGLNGLNPQNYLANVPKALLWPTLEKVESDRAIEMCKERFRRIRED
jgi:hypothetical protein